MIDLTSPTSLIDRFPHLRNEIRLLAEKDSGFRQLNDDYALLLRSLCESPANDSGDRDEIIGLKTSLEVEALEKLSQARIRQS